MQHRLGSTLMAWLGAWLLCTPCAAQQSAANAAGTEARFDLLEFEIVGNSVMSTIGVEKVVLPFMGEQRSLRDVEAARTALEKAYQDAGYLTVFVDVPEQRVDSGVVQLRVTEGRVDRLRVTGARYYSQGFIREKVAELASGNVPNFNVVQKQIDAVNRDERRVQPVLRPGIEPGTVEAELKVVDRLPFTAAVEINNRHPADTDPWRVQATLRYDNLFQLDHSLALTFVTSPREPSETSLLAFNYSAPLDDGWSFLGTLTLSNSEVQPLGAALVLGKGSIVGARWLRTVAAAEGLHTLGVGLDYKNLDEDVVAGDDTVSTPLRYWPLQASYTGSWFDKDSSWSLNSSLVASIRGVDARSVDCPGNVPEVDQFACKREGADGGFAYWRGELRHTRRMLGVPGEWGLRLGWQLASQPLVPTEQYVVGGVDTVRGYLEAAASGDNGLLASLEWRSPELLDANAYSLALNGVVFVEGAHTQLIEVAAGQSAGTSLLGLGMGVRVRAAPTWTGALDLGWPLKRIGTQSREAQFYLRLAGQF